MTAASPAPDRWRAADALSLIARGVLGAVFLYMGLHKASHPVEFLKMVHQYDVLSQPPGLNLVASVLPWLEMFCGLLLVLGVAIRGTAVMLVMMLVPFTALVLLRALALHQAGDLPFCAIKFDCGCGAGEVFVCRKLAENLVLLALSIMLLFRQQARLALRPKLL
jgi:uncharacterized membrane protein YphA (DoxX/SURF4 family)